MNIKLSSGTLDYLDEGSGPGVLLIHAFPLDHTMWQPQVAALSNRFRVIAPDVRGFGGSLPASPWTIEEFCADLAQFLDRLNCSSCAVIGLSLGGYIALPFYSKYPNRVRQLVLANTRARADTDDEKAGRTAMIAALEKDGAAILPDRMIPRLLQPNPSPETVRLVRGLIEKTTATAAIHALIAMRERPDRSDILHRIKCPALVIGGQLDAVTRIEECRVMAQAIPGGRFAEIPDAGHLSNLENPKEFNRLLENWMA